MVILGADGTPYIEITYLENCGITYRICDEPHRVMITYSEESFLAADVVEQTQIRVSQDIKADLLVTLEPGEKVRFIDGGGLYQQRTQDFYFNININTGLDTNLKTYGVQVN